MPMKFKLELDYARTIRRPFCRIASKWKEAYSKEGPIGLFLQRVIHFNKDYLVKDVTYFLAAFIALALEQTKQ